MEPINANNFGSYDQARDAYYNGAVPKFGATRLEWGFGRWLYLPAAMKDADDLSLWETLDELRSLTNDGHKRLARAKKEAAK